MKKYLGLACLILATSTCHADGMLGGTIGSLSSSGGGSGVTVPSSYTWTNITYAGVYYSTNSLNVSHTIVSTDTIIFASSTLTGANTGVTYTLPFSSNAIINNSAQVVQITKVDITTAPVFIVTQGANLIDGTTGLLRLDAPGQTDILIADGANNWWPYAGGIQTTPPYLNPVPSVQANNFTVPTSSNIVVAGLDYVAVPVCVTGFVYDIGTAGGGIATISLGVLDRTGNVMVSTNSVGANLTGTQTVILPNPKCIPPGIYNVAVQPSNTSIVLQGATEGNQGIWGCSETAASAAGIVSLTLPGAAICSTGPGVRVLVGGGRQTYK